MAFDWKKIAANVTEKTESLTRAAQEQFPDSMKKLTDKANEVTKSMQDQLPDSIKNFSGKADELAKSVQNQLPDSMKNIDVKNTVADMAKQGMNTFNRLTKIERETDSKARKIIDGKKDETEVSYKGALRIIYYMMSADNAISEAELGKFDEIGEEIDPLYHTYRDHLIEGCERRLDHSDDEEDYYDNVHDQTGNVIRSCISRKGEGVSRMLLYWNLLAIAYSDGDCSRAERRLIKYVAREFEIDKTKTAEIETSLKTLMSVEREEQFLRESGRSYLEVQKHMEDLAKRKTAIMQGVYALIQD